MLLPALLVIVYVPSMLLSIASQQSTYSQRSLLCCPLEQALQRQRQCCMELIADGTHTGHANACSLALVAVLQAAGDGWDGGADPLDAYMTGLQAPTVKQVMYVLVRSTHATSGLLRKVTCKFMYSKCCPVSTYSRYIGTCHGARARVLSKPEPVRSWLCR